MRRQLKARIEQLVLDIKSDAGLQQNLENWKMILIEKMRFKDQALELAGGFLEAAAAGSDKTSSWIEFICEQVDGLVESLKCNTEQSKRLDAFLKATLMHWADEIRKQIGKMVDDRLSKFTGDMLVELIESRAGNDLQMIRINGSVVGGVVGALIYLLTFWLR